MMGLMTRELVTLLLRLRESLRLFSQEKGHPSRSGVTLETSPWVVSSYKVQIIIGKNGMDTTNVHSQKPRCIELNSC